ncbi:nitrogenase component 1 [Acetobacterium woodii]|uniref:Nitrogenase iron-molybdenum cofactor biosynthesis protein NifE1 n=1 Tax=Acetobacterium woodii (strain ATCC 29683 / DSM 1030 / JCM 2381 / KCTC 1655 / WB1) TaxID=931626 RepID=H6LEB1_ACEWD|nr:nitrogenase component 1 [Acetobacterium woodii]AFA46825.1 nitrogenase iron-molybdenum cofactor biosynthesis protein NifE1 [Acetobacterium woodii DSM 1030]
MRLNRLSEIKKNQDIYGDSAAISCGVFCPTFGVAVSAPLIKEAAVMVVGTAECTWYAKNSCLYHSEDPGYDRFYSCVFEDSDITFGDRGGIKQSLLKIAESEAIQCIFLVSTCIPEIIGEDLEAISKEAQKICGKPILPVHIAHYDNNCNEFGVAIARTLRVQGRLMKPQTVKPGTVNFLGRNFHAGTAGTPKQSELAKCLEQAGVTINLMLPDQCCIKQIYEAPGAALNIVTNEVGRELAEYMQNQFGTPFVEFEASLDINYISAGYQQLEEYLELDLSADYMALQQQAESLVAEARQDLAGKTFINGGRPPDALEVAAFLSALGMKPMLINAYRLNDKSEANRQFILEQGCDPYVNYVANPNAAMSMLTKLQPDLYIGFGNGDYLRQLGISHLETLLPPGKIGYEAIIHVITAIQAALKGGDQDVSCA